MGKINWAYVIVFGIATLLIVLIGVALLGSAYGGWGYGMMGPGMGPGMMRWGFAPFGWLGTIFMWLIPLIFLALLVAGVVWLVRAVGGQGEAHPRTSTATCPACGRPVQSDWRHCPSCGETLS